MKQTILAAMLTAALCMGVSPAKAQSFEEVGALVQGCVDLPIEGDHLGTALTTEEPNEITRNWSDVIECVYDVNTYDWAGFTGMEDPTNGEPVREDFTQMWRNDATHAIIDKHFGLEPDVFFSSSKGRWACPRLREEGRFAMLSPAVRGTINMYCTYTPKVMVPSRPEGFDSLCVTGCGETITR